MYKPESKTDKSTPTCDYYKESTQSESGGWAGLCHLLPTRKHKRANNSE